MPITICLDSKVWKRREEKKQIRIWGRKLTVKYEQFVSQQNRWSEQKPNHSAQTTYPKIRPYMIIVLPNLTLGPAIGQKTWSCHQLVIMSSNESLGSFIPLKFPELWLPVPPRTLGSIGYGECPSPVLMHEACNRKLSAKPCDSLNAGFRQ